MLEWTRKVGLSTRLIATVAVIMTVTVALGGVIIYQTYGNNAGMAAAVLLILFVCAAGAFFITLVVNQVLLPLRRLARKTAYQPGPAQPHDLDIITTRVYRLLDDVGRTHEELELSQARLLNSEKMAVVGKLAADVAHSIRNPMTSIKMRLFSLERGLALNPAQKEDFAVVAEEMRRLDNILRNFLEFSRPPKLKMQRLSVAEVMDQTLELLRHRLEMNHVKVERHRGDRLPVVEADPELLKEVMVNLIVNACDAMKDGGGLTVSENDAVAEHIGRAVVVKVADTGPGIPDTLQRKVLEPFFSTKEDGTGLGLSIALRIVEEHGGRLELRSDEGRGATFIITLPVREDEK